MDILHSFLDPDKNNLVPYEEMLRLFKEPAYLNEFINKRYPQLNDAELLKERRRGEVKTNVQSIADKPLGGFSGTMYPTSGRSHSPMRIASLY